MVVPRNLPPEEEEYYEEEEGLDELPPGEPETFGEKLVAATPWWGISVAVPEIRQVRSQLLPGTDRVESRQEVLIHRGARPSSGYR